MPDIREWLEKQGLGEHVRDFIDNDVDYEALPHLTEAMLKEMGLSIGARAKVMASIELLKSKQDDAEIVPEELGTMPDEKLGIRPDAERRHLTVMFCDLIGSTALSEALDPEDLRALIGIYHEAAKRVVDRYDGHVAQFLGDGVMVYFGWPVAHEDDAERTLRAGLDLLQEVKAIEAPAPLQVRIGVATGLVVVGESDGTEPYIAVGETPNLAARLQSLASVDEIIIDPATRRLVGGVFDLVDFGSHTLKGFADPISASRVDGLARTQDRFEARGQLLIPLVGRDAEINMLFARWANAKDGEGQIVLLEGESGFGKSRLVREFCERVKDDPHAELRYQCSLYHTNSALHPVIEQLEYAAGFEPVDDIEIRLDKLEAILPDSIQTRALFAALLSLETNRYGPLGLTPQKQKKLTLQAFVGRLKELSRDTPVLLIIEDAHWLDPTTQEALDLQLSALGKLNVLAIVTFRPEYKPPWTSMSYSTPLRLTRLGRRYARAIVDVAGADLPDDLRAQIVDKTDGVPLFIEELTNAVQNSSSESEREARLDILPETPPLGIPLTLQNSLTARLDRLGSVKELAQIAACIGRHFSPTLLAAVKAGPDIKLDAALSILVESGLIYPEKLGDEESFAFKHSLIQEAAYSSLLNSTRRKIHAQIASVLITLSGQNYSSDPIVIAQHFRAAQEIREALPWLRRAAEKAAKSGSVQESMEILGHALDLVEELQGSPEERDRAELMLLVDKLPICIAIEGWASDEVNLTCSRALDLAISLGDKAMESVILYQIATMHEVRGEFQKTQEVLGRRDRILSEPTEPEQEVESGELMACSTFYQGHFDKSIEHAKQALLFTDPQKHTVLGAMVAEDPTIACLFWIAKSLLVQGQIDQARAQHRDAFTCAQRSPHWYAESHAEIDAALFFAYQRDFESAIEYAERAIISSAQVGLAYREAVASLIFEWANAETYNHPPDLEKVRTSLSVFQQVGAMIGYGFYLALAAEAHARVGEHEQSDELIIEAIQTCTRGRGFFYESDLHRLSGDLKRGRSESHSSSDIESCYQQGLRIARAQGARLFELRNGKSIAQLWLEQGQRDKARDLLSPIYYGFTEGFDSNDLIEAKAILESLE